MTIESYTQPKEKNTLNIITKLKISNSLIGKFPNENTKLKMSKSKKGDKNPFYLIGLPKKTLDAAAEKLGIPVYVYDINLNLLKNKPFRSIREASLYTKISKTTLSKKLDTGKLFKGYYYYSKVL